MTREQAEAVEAFAHWQRRELLDEADLVARKARHATRAINALLECLHGNSKSVQHRSHVPVPIITKVRP